jgi:alkylation response protein AidB-like acyl-CoA dehydrogenase
MTLMEVIQRPADARRLLESTDLIFVSLPNRLEIPGLFLGYVKGRGIERFYRDVRAFRIYEGTSQIHHLNIARYLLRNAQNARW